LAMLHTISSPVSAPNEPPISSLPGWQLGLAESPTSKIKTPGTFSLCETPNTASAWREIENQALPNDNLLVRGETGLKTLPLGTTMFDCETRPRKTVTLTTLALPYTCHLHFLRHEH
jgi:hypothetical protein